MIFQRLPDVFQIKAVPGADQHGAGAGHRQLAGRPVVRRKKRQLVVPIMQDPHLNGRGIGQLRQGSGVREKRPLPARELPRGGFLRPQIVGGGGLCHGQIAAFGEAGHGQQPVFVEQGGEGRGVSFGKPLPGEDENLGRGVSYCATCDAALYRGREAAVVGYAPNEENDVRFLAELADKVTYIPVYKKDQMPAEGTALFSEFTNIEVKIAKPEAVEKREDRMVLITDQGEVISDGIFLLRESVAPDKLVPGLELDGSHVKVDRKMASNLPGLFAAGDITGTPYQYIKAAGEGNVAALSAVAYIDNLK